MFKPARQYRGLPPVFHRVFQDAGVQDGGVRSTSVSVEEADRISRHNLLTPLNSMISLSQLLQDEPNLTPEQREVLNVIIAAGQRMHGMIHLSLRLAMMEQGRYESNPVPVDLAKILRNVKVELHCLLVATNVFLDVEAEGWPLPLDEPFMIMGEELLCYSLLANLVRNAVEASPYGGEVTVSLERFQDCHITIRNGGEVPAGFRDVFFEKYSTHGKKGGTGLGTYSARIMARAMGGDVDLDCSQAGVTIVHVRLPCRGATI
ncbi:MAG TPA: hypothetical protein DCG53_00855 [Syntrophus sp. (in: bacteria)]|jgi:signal transduction histidine kinase|nr:hypothetical protein [Syntrophus sp. (in: bacteria)]